jgi:hypothetical protein
MIEVSSSLGIGRLGYCVLAAGGSYTTPESSALRLTAQERTHGCNCLLGLIPAAKRPVVRCMPRTKSTVLRHDCSASSDREELPTHGLQGTTGTDAIDRNISEASKPAVISRSVLDSEHRT